MRKKTPDCGSYGGGRFHETTEKPEAYLQSTIRHTPSPYFTVPHYLEIDLRPHITLYHSTFSPADFFLDTWPLKMEPIGGPETSVLNQPMLRNNPWDGRILLTHQG
jgi:hypothetical protein